MADVFISYSHADRAFVRHPFDALEAEDRDAWVDWEGIPPTLEWLSEIYMAGDPLDHHRAEKAGRPAASQADEGSSGGDIPPRLR